MISQIRSNTPVGLMLSGGVDSAVLLAHLLDQGHRVQPFYVATGCCWETAETEVVRAFLQAVRQEAVLPLVQFHIPTGDLNPGHWSLTGRHVPDEATPDEAVEMPGRNPLLLLKPMLWCARRGISQLALGTLAANPFADASPEFLQQFESALAVATGELVEIILPFARKQKSEILALGDDLPWQHTFSCLAPVNGLHCGRCNKCAERKLSLQLLPTGDPTCYAVRSPALN